MPCASHALPSSNRGRCPEASPESPAPCKRRGIASAITAPCVETADPAAGKLRPAPKTSCCVTRIVSALVNRIHSSFGSPMNTMTKQGHGGQDSAHPRRTVPSTVRAYSFCLRVRHVRCRSADPVAQEFAVEPIAPLSDVTILGDFGGMESPRTRRGGGRSRRPVTSEVRWAPGDPAGKGIGHRCTVRSAGTRR